MRAKCLRSISRNTNITLGLVVVLFTVALPATWAMAFWTHRQSTRYERMEKDLTAIKKALNNAGILPEWQSSATSGWLPQLETNTRRARDANIAGTN